MEKRHESIRNMLVVDRKVLFQIPAMYFLLHCIFSMTISYFYTVTSDSTLVELVRLSYRLRDVCFVLAAVQIVLKLKISGDDIFLVGMIGIFYMITRVLFPQNMVYIESISAYLILGIECYAVIRTKLLEWKLLKRWTTRFSRIFIVAVILGILTVPNQAQYIAKQYMTFANALTLPTGFVMYEAFCRAKSYDYCLFAIGLISILAFGSRGSFVLLALLFLVYIYSRNQNKKVLYVGLGLLLVLWIGADISGVGDNIVSGLLGNSNSRTLSSIFSGSLFKSQRTRVYAYLGKCIVSDVFLGAGLCADRYYLPMAFTGNDANYAHNFFLEWTVDFGLIGLLIAIAVTIFILKNTFSMKNREKKWYFYTFFFLIFLQLMISRSWLTEINFFVYAALLMNHTHGERENES